MIPTRLLATALTAVALGTLGLAAPHAVARQQPAAQGVSMPIAVIDVERLLSESAAAKNLIEQTKSIGEKYQAQLTTYSKDIEQLQQQIREANADSPAARDARTQLIMKNAAGQALLQQANQETERAKVLGTLKLLNLIKDAVTQVAQQRQVGVVLRKAPPVPAGFDPSNQQQAQQVQGAMQFQIAFYAAPALDITTDVMLKMDENFKANPAATTGQ